MERDPRQTPQPQPYLGEAIRALRRERGLSQEALAPEAEITPGTLSLIERGEANPTWGTVQGIAAALGVPVSTLAKAAETLESGMAKGQIIRFKIGEAFPADEPLARWVTVCAMALNDALLVNRWLWPRLQEEVPSEAHENFYLARVAAAHLFEAAVFLRKYRQQPQIKAFIEGLEPEHQEQYAALLEIGKGDQKGFPKQLKEARNTFFHYPELIFGQEDREPLKRAMIEHSKDEEEQGIERGEIRDLSPPLQGFRAGFADDIATEMMLPENTGEEFPEFIHNVSTNLSQLLGFLKATLNAYAQTKPETWEVEKVGGED